MHGIETYREGAHTIRVVRDRLKFAKFRRRWNGALAEYPEASIYSTHEWIQAIWDIYREDIAGHVTMIDDSRGPCALAAFMDMRYRYGGISFPAVGPIPAARTDVPLIRDQVACMRLLGSYTRHRGAQIWHLHDVPEKSPVLQLLQSEWDLAGGVEEYARQGVPVIDTSRSWPEYLHRRGEAFQEHVAEIHAGLDGLGFQTVADPAALLAVINRVKKRSGAAPEPVEDYRGIAFQERIVRDAAASGTLRSVVAYDETLFARPAVAVTWGLEYNGTLHVFDTCGDARYPAARIGSFAEALWTAFDSDRVRRVDLSELDPGDPALNWATDEAIHVSTLVLNGGIGSAAVRAGRTFGSLKRAFALPQRRGGKVAA